MIESYTRKAIDKVKDIGSNSFLNFIIVLVVSMTLLGCTVVKRSSQPKLVGFIYDAKTKQPLGGCQVGDILTDEKGYYEIPSKCYYEITFMAWEAPPLRVSLFVKKPGYEVVLLEGYNSFGGANCPVSWSAKPIFLKRDEENHELNGTQPWREVSL